MYKCEIVNCTRPELSPIERIALKEGGSFISINTELENAENHMLDIDFDYMVELHIENDKSEDKEYNKYVFADTDGNLYTTGSISVKEAFDRMYSEIKDFDGWSLRFMLKPSKNRGGKNFITCTVKVNK